MPIKMTMKKIAVGLSMSAIATLAVLPTPSIAVTPDPHYSISGFWTFPRAFTELFDWRSFAGWGSVGAINTVALALTGASEGDVTTAAFTTLCGSGTAAVLANWKPVSDPSASSHIKAIIKAAGVTSVASACNWVAPSIFGRMDLEIRKAQNYINYSMNATDLDDLKTAASRITASTESARVTFRNIAFHQSELDKAKREYHALYCDEGGSGGIGLIAARCMHLSIEMAKSATKISEAAKDALYFGDTNYFLIQQIGRLIKT
ncbi:hypothetical protein [Acidovorax sp. Leaf78]|uniref:hypothetical protein n=1 Tax=unclassified Acidovorax TaxID=2684926 RepID=UPI000AD7FA54|nr:hypothetical protein [Acidovorax sp. Leaf78]